MSLLQDAIDRTACAWQAGHFAGICRRDPDWHILPESALDSLDAQLPNGSLLVDSDHCSGYNWRSGHLTHESFEAVFARIKAPLA